MTLVPPEPPSRARVPHMSADELVGWRNYALSRTQSEYIPNAEKARWRTVFEAVDAELVRRFGRVRHG